MQLAWLFAVSYLQFGAFGLMPLSRLFISINCDKAIAYLLWNLTGCTAPLGLGILG